MVHDLFDASGPGEVGRKGEHLRWLVRAGLRVPRTLVLPFDEAAALLDGNDARAGAVRADVAARIDPDRPYAVRSSADVEDGAEVSFAGQFVTRLDVVGADAVMAAAVEVAGSAGGESVADSLALILPAVWRFNPPPPPDHRPYIPDPRTHQRPSA